MVFERLFGEGGTPEERQAALQNRASLLDSFSADVQQLKARLTAGDRIRVDQYLDSIREVERQIQRAEHGAMNNPEPDMDRPTGFIRGPCSFDVRSASACAAGRFDEGYYFSVDS